jgi:hypothetical protein
VAVFSPEVTSTGHRQAWKDETEAVPFFQKAFLDLLLEQVCGALPFGPAHQLACTVEMDAL